VISCLDGTNWRAGLNEVSTLFRDRDPEFLKTLVEVKAITKEMEEPEIHKLAA